MCHALFLDPGNRGMNKKNSPSSPGAHVVVGGDKQQYNNK